ncbi:MAG TPA: PilZ domain-containing protein [Candidatus Limnocylindria bacterium]|nr:PilZ domain-containing protein [Candidatus Limnocylindria bacterium]
MGRRSEARVAKHAPVLVRGTDPSGNPFAITAHVRDISGSGASLTGLNGVGTPGTKVEIEFQGRKARYRIQWVGKEGTPLASQVGLRCLEPGNFIWGVQLPEWTEDTYDLTQTPAARPVLSSSPSGNGAATAAKERRRFPRHICRIEALVTIEGTDMSSPAIISDISLSGCYLEMLSPLPVNTLIELTMSLSHTNLHVHGNVRTSQMGMGMGVAFTGLTPEDFETLRKLAPPEGSALKPATASAAPPARENEAEFELQHERTRPAPEGAAQSVITGQPSTADALEAILRALFKKGILSRSEVAEELQKLMTTKS